MLYKEFKKIKITRDLIVNCVEFFDISLHTFKCRIISSRVRTFPLQVNDPKVEKSSITPFIVSWSKDLSDCTHCHFFFLLRRQKAAEQRLRRQATEIIPDRASSDARKDPNETKRMIKIDGLNVKSTFGAGIGKSHLLYQGFPRAFFIAVPPGSDRCRTKSVSSTSRKYQRERWIVPSDRSVAADYLYWDYFLTSSMRPEIANEAKPKPRGFPGRTADCRNSRWSK